MRLEWLEDILAVAEAGSLSLAAERRRLTQSAFSRRIRFIEDMLGVELFDRSRKPIRLTPVAQDQLETIARMAGALRQLQNDLRLGARQSGNRIVIASQHALTAGFSPHIIKTIDARCEGIYVRLRSANLDDCFALLLSRQADIALLYRPPGEEHPVEADYLETMTIASDRLIPVAHPELAAALPAEAEGGEVPVVAYPAEVFLGQLVSRMVYAHDGALPRLIPKAETALTLAALEMALVGLGVAWIPRSLAEDRLAAGGLVDLGDRLPACPLDITAVRLARGSSQAELALWRVLAEEFASRLDRDRGEAGGG